MHFEVAGSLRKIVERLAAATGVFGAPANNLCLAVDQAGAISLWLSGFQSYAATRLQAKTLLTPGQFLTSSGFITRLPESETYKFELKQGRLYVSTDGGYVFDFEVSSVSADSKFETLDFIPPVIALPADQAKKFGLYATACVPFAKPADTKAMNAFSTVRFEFDGATVNMQALTEHEAIFLDLPLQQTFPQATFYVPAKVVERINACGMFNENLHIGYADAQNVKQDSRGILTLYSPSFTVSYNTLSGAGFPAQDLKDLRAAIEDPNFKPSSIQLDINTKPLNAHLKVLGGFLTGFPLLIFTADGTNVVLEAKTNLAADKTTLKPPTVVSTQLAQPLTLPFKAINASFTVFEELGAEVVNCFDLDKSNVIFRHPALKILIAIVRVWTKA